jgi:hypothetical protein
MDLLSYLPPIASFVVVPIGIAVVLRLLAGETDDDEARTMFASFFVDPFEHAGRVIPEVEHVPWRFESLVSRDVNPAAPTSGGEAGSPRLARKAESGGVRPIAPQHGVA